MRHILCVSVCLCNCVLGGVVMMEEAISLRRVIKPVCWFCHQERFTHTQSRAHKHTHRSMRRTNSKRQSHLSQCACPWKSSRHVIPPCRSPALVSLSHTHTHTHNHMHKHTAIDTFVLPTKKQHGRRETVIFSSFPQSHSAYLHCNKPHAQIPLCNFCSRSHSFLLIVLFLICSWSMTYPRCCCHHITSFIYTVSRVKTSSCTPDVL